MQLNLKVAWFMAVISKCLVKEGDTRSHWINTMVWDVHCLPLKNNNQDMAGKRADTYSFYLSSTQFSPSFSYSTHPAPSVHSSFITMSSHCARSYSFPPSTGQHVFHNIHHVLNVQFSTFLLLHCKHIPTGLVGRGSRAKRNQNTEDIHMKHLILERWGKQTNHLIMAETLIKKYSYREMRN